MRAQSARNVGQPLHEIALTDSILRHASILIKPGPGRSLFVIPEASIGRGRPDVVIVVASRAAVGAYLESNLRITSPREAAAIVEFYSPDAARNRSDHPTRFGAWSTNAVKRFSSAVVDSVAIEAKVKDWKQAIRQASRFRHLVHRAAIMLPGEEALERSAGFLETYKLGYISLRKGRPRVSIPASRQDVGPDVRLWLLELAARTERIKHLPKI